MNIEQQYLNCLSRLLSDEACVQENRTGIKTRMIPSMMVKHDLSKGFPLLTTRKLSYKSVVGELLGFLRGYTSAYQFRELGCTFWDQNANETPSWVNNPNRKGADDLGLLPYSVSWRNCPNGADFGGGIDQVKNLINQLTTDPTSRRMVVSAWHPELFPYAALEPCHVMWGVVFSQEEKKINIWWMQRSTDAFLGLPANLASYATLAHMLAKVSGYSVGKITGFLADCHLYENHIEQTKEQLSRTPYDLPTLFVKYDQERIKGEISNFEPNDFDFCGTYECHPTIKAPMAV